MQFLHDTFPNEKYPLLVDGELPEIYSNQLCNLLSVNKQINTDKLLHSSTTNKQFIDVLNTNDFLVNFLDKNFPHALPNLKILNMYMSIDDPYKYYDIIKRICENSDNLITLNIIIKHTNEKGYTHPLLFHLNKKDKKITFSITSDYLDDIERNNNFRAIINNLSNNIDVLDINIRYLSELKLKNPFQNLPQSLKMIYFNIWSPASNFRSVKINFVNSKLPMNTILYFKFGEAYGDSFESDEDEKNNENGATSESDEDGAKYYNSNLKLCIVNIPVNNKVIFKSESDLIIEKNTETFLIKNNVDYIIK